MRNIFSPLDIRSQREPSQLLDSGFTSRSPSWRSRGLAELPQQIEHLGRDVLVDRPLIDGFQRIADLTDRRSTLFRAR